MRLDTGALLARTEGGTQISVEIRPLVSHDDLRACVTLQRLTWGEAFGEVTPPSLLKIATRLGGVAAGAFGAHGALLGFVFGMTGVERGNIVHWSHMLGVLPQVQNQGIGRRLKEYQRAAVAKVGAATIYWTFDPLVARNAHLNINVLGVRATDYVEDMYGESTSPLHRGIGTDRLIVAWPVSDAEVAARKSETSRISRDVTTGMQRIEIPADIEALQQSDMKSARAWREKTRMELQSALASGHVIQGFQLDEKAQRGYYILGKGEEGRGKREAGRGKGK